MSVQLILMGVIRIATIVLARSFALVIMDTGSMLMARLVMVSECTCSVFLQGVCTIGGVCINLYSSFNVFVKN